MPVVSILRVKEYNVPFLFLMEVIEFVVFGGAKSVRFWIKMPEELW